MSVYSILAAGHALLGTLALFAFWSAGLARKGSPFHRGAGRVYLLAMASLLALALPLSVQVWRSAGTVLGAFLVYLLVIVVTSTWCSWRAVRDKRDWPRYTGPVYRALTWANLVAALAIVALGLFVAQRMQLIIVTFSAIGFANFVQMRRFARRTPPEPRWWLREHLTAMLGNGVATHIAFLSIGLPRLLPALQTAWFQNLAWIGPLAVALLAGLWLTRKYLPPRVPERKTTAAIEANAR